MHVHVLSTGRANDGLWSLHMKTSSLVALLVAGAAIAAPAIAGTSISRGKSICEAAVKAQTPAPKSVRTDADKTRVNDTTLTYTLKVRNADDSAGALTCKVDRSTDAATVTPAS
jgi:siroheme synthase